MNIMTRSEREDLQRLVRQREKVLKSAAKQRSSELVADFVSFSHSEGGFIGLDLSGTAVTPAVSVIPIPSCS